MKKLPPRAENLRRALAQEAARIMSEHGIRDFLTAKRKAAERFGVTDGSVLPKNTEIEDALAEYHRLFGGARHDETLSAQRNAALSAMQMLSDFEPRLVGPVLSGTATEHNDIQLHLFAERAESITKWSSAACATAWIVSSPIRACISSTTTTRWTPRYFRWMASARHRSARWTASRCAASTPMSSRCSWTPKIPLRRSEAPARRQPRLSMA
jgi:hypothetical protein